MASSELMLIPVEYDPFCAEQVEAPASLANRLNNVKQQAAVKHETKTVTLVPVESNPFEEPKNEH